MPKIKEVEPPTLPTPAVPAHYPCSVTEKPEGLSVTFTIEPSLIKRYKTRAGNMPLERYIWENLLARAVVDHVY
jgi:hypothetical protein